MDFIALASYGIIGLFAVITILLTEISKQFIAKKYIRFLPLVLALPLALLATAVNFWGLVWSQAFILDLCKNIVLISGLSLLNYDMIIKPLKQQQAPDQEVKQNGIIDANK